MATEAHGFEEHGARRIVRAVRTVEGRLRNQHPHYGNQAASSPGFWARLGVFGEDEPAYFDFATRSFSWIRQMQQPDGTWIDHPLGFHGRHRGASPDDAAAFEVHDLVPNEGAIVWMRPGADDEIDGKLRATRCYLFSAQAEWWYARLTSRSGRAYTWEEIEPQWDKSPTSGWSQCADPKIFVNKTGLVIRSGTTNAYDLNGAAHNSQGGAQAVVVRMWQGGVIPPSPGVPYFLFDFATTNECDGERQVFQP